MRGRAPSNRIRFARNRSKPQVHAGPASRGEPLDRILYFQTLPLAKTAPVVKLLRIGLDELILRGKVGSSNAPLKHKPRIRPLRLIEKMGDIAGSEPIGPMHQSVDFVALFRSNSVR